MDTIDELIPVHEANIEHICSIFKGLHMKPEHEVHEGIELNGQGWIIVRSHLTVLRTGHFFHFW